MCILCFYQSNDPHSPLQERIRNKYLFLQRHLHLKIHSHLIYKVQQIMNSLPWTHLLYLFVTSSFFFFFFFPAVLGLHCCSGFYSSCGKQELLSSCSVRASCCSGSSCGAQASVGAARGLSCSMVCRIIWDQG